MSGRRFDSRLVGWRAFILPDYIRNTSIRDLLQDLYGMCSLLFDFAMFCCYFLLRCKVECTVVAYWNIY